MKKERKKEKRKKERKKEVESIRLPYVGRKNVIKKINKKSVVEHMCDGLIVDPTLH